MAYPLVAKGVTGAQRGTQPGYGPHPCGETSSGAVRQVGARVRALLKLIGEQRGRRSPKMCV